MWENLSHYFSGKPGELEAGPDEWDVEAIVGHRIGPTGAPEFLVRWKNWDPSDLTWQPWTDFFPRYNEDFLRYCAEKGVGLDLGALLAPGKGGGKGVRRH